MLCWILCTEPEPRVKLCVLSSGIELSRSTIECTRRVQCARGGIRLRSGVRTLPRLARQKLTAAAALHGRQRLRTWRVAGVKRCKICVKLASRH